MKKYLVTIVVWMLLASNSALAYPPQVDFPSETKATGDYVTIIPKTDAKAISYIAQSYTDSTGAVGKGVDAFPSALLKDSRTFMLPVRGLPAGKYTYTGVASLNDEFTDFKFSVIVGEQQANPNPPTPIPPTPDAVEAPVRLFVVEETANRTVQTAKLLQDFEFWNGLEKEGYVARFYDISSADAKRLNLDKIKQPLPFIVVASNTGAVLGSYPLPTTREGVRKILPPIRGKVNLSGVSSSSSVIPASSTTVTSSLPTEWSATGTYLDSTGTSVQSYTTRQKLRLRGSTSVQSLGTCGTSAQSSSTCGTSTQSYSSVQSYSRIPLFNRKMFLLGTRRFTICP